jgi:DegV family protein with EDD domain
MATKIIVDSGADITRKEAEELGMIHMPIEVRMNGKDYLDGENLFAEEFYNELATCSELPKTSQITPLRYQEMFDKIVADGDEAVVICLSSRLSNTYNNARMTAENYDGKIVAVDSMTAFIGQRALCMYAIELVKKGYNAKKVAEKLEERKGDIRLYAVIDTLKYLKMGGRLSAASAFIGTLLAIKPIISVTEGEVRSINKAMGFKKGNKMIMDMCSKSNIDYKMPMHVGYSGNDMSNIEGFLAEVNSSNLERKFEKDELCAMGSTIGTHIGPGAVAICYFEK